MLVALFVLYFSGSVRSTYVHSFFAPMHRYINQTVLNSQDGAVPFAVVVFEFSLTPNVTHLHN